MLAIWGYFDGRDTEHYKKDWKVTEETGCGYLRIYDVLGGDVTCYEKNRTIRLPVGSVCMLPSSEPYALRQKPDDRFVCRYYHVTIRPAFLSAATVLDAPPGSFVRSFFDAAAAAMEEKNDVVLLELFEAFRLYCQTKKLFYEPGGEIGRVLAAMAISVEKNWTVQEMSRLAGYSEAYFIRLFHRETGMSPHQYLTEARMRTAIELLQTGVPVTQAAERAGYAELKTFSRAFRQRYGVSPSQYRENIRFFP